MPLLPKVQTLVDNTESSNDAVNARCALALQLARKLDEAVDSTSGASAMAVPSLSKELRASIDEISSVEGRKDQFRAAIFADE